MLYFFRRVASWFVPKISWISWNALRALFNGGVYFSLTEEDWEYLRNALADDYYIILTRNSAHLSTYLVSIGNVFATGKWGFWGHALMNLENESPITDLGFKLMESTSVGVHYSSFQEVFRCDAVCLLKPKGLTKTEWTAIMDGLLLQNGKKYDNLFDLSDESQVSCVEMVREALQALPNYYEMFPNLEEMIVKNGNNLTPEMFYTCPDFEIVWEVRR
jgi:hypothetical protein